MSLKEVARVFRRMVTVSIGSVWKRLLVEEYEWKVCTSQ
jgi:hypothetical protein